MAKAKKPTKQATQTLDLVKTTLADFDVFAHGGYVDDGILQLCTIFSCGRWTPLSLYSVYMRGLEVGTFADALNLMGLTDGDLTPDEADSAKRMYLMSRARNLAQVKSALTGQCRNSKEAEVLLKYIYRLETGGSDGVGSVGLVVNVTGGA